MEKLARIIIGLTGVVFIMAGFDSLISELFMPEVAVSVIPLPGIIYYLFFSGFLVLEPLNFSLIDFWYLYLIDNDYPWMGGIINMAIGVLHLLFLRYVRVSLKWMMVPVLFMFIFIMLQASIFGVLYMLFYPGALIYAAAVFILLKKYKLIFSGQV